MRLCPAAAGVLQTPSQFTLTHSYDSVSGWRLSVDSNIYGHTSESRERQNCAGIWGHTFEQFHPVSKFLPHSCFLNRISWKFCILCQGGIYVCFCTKHKWFR